jgi:hypothetical protein
MVKMVDMKHTAAEKKARDKKFDHRIGGENEYPYGLHISLGDSELSKLGVAKLPQVGSKLKVHAHAHVKSASESSSEGGKERRVELELRHMHVEGAHGEKGKTPKEDMSEEGMRRGAKAAMDKVLPKNKVGKKDLGEDDDDDDDAENG